MSKCVRRAEFLYRCVSKQVNASRNWWRVPCDCVQENVVVTWRRMSECSRRRKPRVTRQPSGESKAKVEKVKRKSGERSELMSYVLG